MKLIEEYIKEITNHIDPKYDWFDECLLNQLNIYHNFIDIGIKKSELTSMKIRIKKKFNKIINHAYHICGEYAIRHLNSGSIPDKYHKILKQ